MKTKFTIGLAIIFICGCAGTGKRNVAQVDNEEKQSHCVEDTEIRKGVTIVVNDKWFLGPNKETNIVRTEKKFLNMDKNLYVSIGGALNPNEARKFNKGDELKVVDYQDGQIIVSSAKGNTYFLTCSRKNYIDGTWKPIPCGQNEISLFAKLKPLNCNYYVTPAKQPQVEQDTNAPVEL